jgi:RimJ/RimL family protein N-acetyltransferase
VRNIFDKEIFRLYTDKNDNEEIAMKLRPYKPCDAEVILSWIRDEETFRRWSTDRYDHYPITPADMNHKYLECNGDCPEPDNFYPVTAVHDGVPVGHLILRYTGEDVLRFGFVIVDDTKRGAGYGKEMLRLAIEYAFEIMKAKKVTLGVLENNPGAYYCYKAVGFRDVPTDKPEYYPILGEQVKCLELALER